MLHAKIHVQARLATWSTLSLLRTGLLAIACLVPTTTATSQTGGGPFRIGVKTDAFEDVAGANLIVAQGTTGIQAVCDSSGHSPMLSVDHSEPLTIILHETPTTTFGGGWQAITIGQQYVIPVIEPQPAGYMHYYFQPTARFMQFSSSIGTSDSESGWISGPATNPSPYSFDAAGAELPTKEVVAAYFAYSTGAINNSYLHGVLLRLEQDVSIGSNSMIVAIDTDGYGYTAADPPLVEAVYTGDDPAGNGFSVSLLEFTTQEGVTRIHLALSGVLRDGDNLILIKDPQGASIRRALDPGGLSLVSPPAGIEMCTPPIPATDTNCVPPACIPDPSGCDDGPSVGQCVAKFVWIGLTVCRPCEVGPVTEQQCSTFKGGIAAKLGLSGVFEVSASGEVSGTKCMTISPNRGYCEHAFACFAHCTAACHELVGIAPNGNGVWRDKALQCTSPPTLNVAYCKFADCPPPPP